MTVLFPKNTIIDSSSVEIKPFFYSSRVNTSSPVLITVLHGNVFCSQTCAKQEYLLSMLEKCPSSNYISFPYSLLENHSLTWLTSQKKIKWCNISQNIYGKIPFKKITSFELDPWYAYTQITPRVIFFFGRKETFSPEGRLSVWPG